MKKYFLLIGILFFSFNLFAQVDSMANKGNDQTVTMTVTGQGKTIDEAKTNALRSAIEQAFGTFISSSTIVLNDGIIKDEIISLTNGNIKSYQIISEIKLDDQNTTVTLSVVVSLNKLSAFVKNKGFAIKFNGDLFATNILLKEFNKENEEKIMYENTQIAMKLITNIFDYKIKATPPKMQNNGMWGVGITIQVLSNENSELFYDWFHKIIKAITIPKNEISEYKNLDMDFFKVGLTNGENLTMHGEDYYFRNKKSVEYLDELLKKMISQIKNYEVTNASDFKVGEYLDPDPEILKINSWYLALFDNGRYGRPSDHTFSKISIQMPKTVNGCYKFVTFKKGVKIISFTTIDYLNIDEIKKITEYKITPKKH